MGKILTNKIEILLKRDGIYPLSGWCASNKMGPIQSTTWITKGCYGPNLCNQMLSHRPGKGRLWYRQRPKICQIRWNYRWPITSRGTSQRIAVLKGWHEYIQYTGAIKGVVVEKKIVKGPGVCLILRERWIICAYPLGTYFHLDKSGSFPENIVSSGMKWSNFKYTSLSHRAYPHGGKDS